MSDKLDKKETKQFPIKTSVYFSKEQVDELIQYTQNRGSISSFIRNATMDTLNEKKKQFMKGV